MARTKLFSPITIHNLELSNRIIVAPMCQYAAVDGQMTDWHVMHLGNLAVSGAGLLTIEATAVEAEGRISYADVGLYSDACETAMGRTLDAVRRWSDMPIAVQLAHAGRKASTELPWRGGAQIAADQAGGWRPMAPSPLPFRPDDPPPHALDGADLTRIREAFAAAARRAARLDLSAIQLHAAHGYLLHQFLSPLSNRRTDAYGGSLDQRMRFPLEVFDAVRESFPAERPVSVRVSATDWVEGGWDLEQTVAFTQALGERGVAGINVSSGGLSPDQQIALGPSYQVPMARTIRQRTGLPVVAIGLITEFEQAEAILATGDVDMIGLARAMLYDPRWPWHAAAHFGETVVPPNQYLRCAPRHAHSLFRPAP